MHRKAALGACLSLVLASACSNGNRSTSDSLGPGADGQDEGDVGSDDGGGDGGDQGEKWDISYEDDTPEGGGGDHVSGCEKIDFLFVVDNSGSMEDEQQNLVTSFPGFIATIQDTLEAEDFRVMAIDTDAMQEGGGSMSCSPAPQCCEDWCRNNYGGTCNGSPCPAPDEPCDAELGGGRNEDQHGNPCPIDGGNRYMIDGQVDLPGTFDCVARVGINGDGNEQAMAAMEAALTTLNEPDQCNAGFVRDDAVLVITIITDEEDDPNDPDTGAGPDENSPGDPQSWMQTVTGAKNGDETAVVILALVGDTDLPDATCEPLLGDGTTGAEPAPRLRRFAELFTYGKWCSVCAPDFTPCFEDAVSVIDAACEEFDPPG